MSPTGASRIIFDQSRKSHADMDTIKQLIRDIPDFPKPGILFKDLTPLLRDPSALRLCAELLSAPFSKQNITAVLGMEARGFIFGTLVAQQLGVGFVPLRKPGKLPAAIFEEDYALEYGSATLAMHQDALAPHDRVLIVDDLLATGGTADASVRLARRAGAQVVGCSFVVELDFLSGREALDVKKIHSLVHF